MSSSVQYVDLENPEEFNSKALVDLLEALKHFRKSPRVYKHTVVDDGLHTVLSTTSKDTSLEIAVIGEEGRVALVRFIREQFDKHDCSELMIGSSGKDADHPEGKYSPKALYITATGPGSFNISRTN